MITCMHDHAISTSEVHTVVKMVILSTKIAKHIIADKKIIHDWLIYLYPIKSTINGFKG